MISERNPLSKPRATFATAFSPRQNAFGFLRCALALTVIFSHTFTLGGFGPEPGLLVSAGGDTLGIVAVSLFFVLSGFLITRSAVQASSCARFLWHRFLRIFPGYWVCLIVTALVFAPTLAWIEHGAFFRVFQAPTHNPFTYVTSNWSLYFGQFTIAGLMRRIPYPYIVNGSLWSLPFEVVCYAAVAVLGAAGIFRRAPALLLGLFAALWVLHVATSLSPGVLKNWWPLFDEAARLFLYFCSGALAWLFREKLPFDLRWFALAVLLIPVALLCDAFPFVAPVALPYAVLFLALRLPWSRFERHGDFSYGLYIYAFPVQQMLALLNVQRAGFTAYFVAAAALTFALAILSHRFVEAPCLRLKNAAFPQRIADWFRWKKLSRPPAVALAEA